MTFKTFVIHPAFLFQSAMVLLVTAIESSFLTLGLFAVGLIIISIIRAIALSDF